VIASIGVEAILALAALLAERETLDGQEFAQAATALLRDQAEQGETAVWPG
jgi:hypothetical protein